LEVKNFPDNQAEAKLNSLNIRKEVLKHSSIRTSVIRTRRVHCSSRHISVFVNEWEEGYVTVKCGLLTHYGDSCPYLKNPNYKSEYKPKETKQEVEK